jgi:hypothetical protein
MSLGRPGAHREQSFLQPSLRDVGPLLRRLGLACETGMRCPSRFHPGRKMKCLAPREGLEPSLHALTVRCLADRPSRKIRCPCEELEAAALIATCSLVDPLGVEPRPDGLRVRYAACYATGQCLAATGVSPAIRTRTVVLRTHGLLPLS